MGGGSGENGVPEPARHRAWGRADCGEQEPAGTSPAPQTAKEKRGPAEADRA